MKKLFSLLTTLVMAVGLCGVLPASAEDIVNNKPALATNGVWRNGYIGYSDDDCEFDYYPINISTTGKLTINMQSFGYLSFDIMDSDYETLKTFSSYNGSSGNPENFSEWYYLKKGTYYVRVRENYYEEGASGSYRVKASFESANSNEKEPNDTYLQAQSVSNGSTITGTITYNNDQYDYYKIKVSKKMNYSFYVTAYGNGIYFDLYDNNLNNITDNQITYSYNHCYKDETKQFTYTLNAGTYYVRMSESGDCKYILKFNPSNKVKKKTPSNRLLKKSTKKSKKVKKPAKVSRIRVTRRGRRNAVVTWSRVRGAKGYQVKWSPYKDFSYSGKKSVKKGKLTLRYLYSNKYYIKVRAFKKVKGKRVYGKYSKVVKLSYKN